MGLSKKPEHYLSIIYFKQINVKRKLKVVNTNIGSSFESLLEETGEQAEINAIAIKQVIAWEISQMMISENISKTEMATRLQTSRSALDRLLDPNNTSITLNTLDHAARTIGKKLHIELIAA